jgi:hypothetical protein
MEALALSLLLTAASCWPISADPPARRVPVSVQLAGDDGLTQRLSAALRDGLRMHPRLRPAEGSDEAALTIRSDSNVGWDRLGGRLVVIYTVYVGRSGDGTSPHVGICYERRLSKCVNDILRIAVNEAEDPQQGSTGSRHRDRTAPIRSRQPPVARE